MKTNLLCATAWQPIETNYPTKLTVFSDQFFCDKYLLINIKLFPDLEVLEAVVLELPGNERAFVSSLAVTDPGLSFSLFVYGGAQPYVLGHLDENLTLLNKKGYLINTGTYPHPDGAFSFGQFATLNLNSTNLVDRWNYGYSFSQTDATGTIPNCEDVPVCLEIRDTTIQITPINFEATPTDPPFLRSPLNFEPFTFSTEPFCQEVAMPDATFSYPDTLPIGRIPTPSTENSITADSRLWTLTGPGVDTSRTRWPSLVYSENSAFPRWYGRIKGQVAKQGTYVIVWEFVNLKNGETVLETQDVVLIR